MNDQKFSEAINEAITEIGDRYIEETLSYKPHRIRRRIVRIAAAAACFVLLFQVGRFCVIKNRQGWFTHYPKYGDLLPESESWNGKYSYLEQGAPTPAESTTEEQKRALLYSQLVKPHNVDTTLTEKFGGSFASIDIDNLNCEDMRDCPAVVEGTILEMHTNTYNFTTHFDKFEPDGILNNRRDTVVYTIAVEKVWKGDFLVGDIVTVEDDFFFCDSVISICEGNTFVIPLVEYGDKIMTPEEPIEGDIMRESVYSSWSLFFPQIEKAEGGYIAADCYEPIVSGCERVAMDDERIDRDDYYFTRMYYIPDELFTQRMNELLF